MFTPIGQLGNSLYLPDGLTQDRPSKNHGSPLTSMPAEQANRLNRNPIALFNSVIRKNLASFSGNSTPLRTLPPAYQQPTESLPFALGSKPPISSEEAAGNILDFIGRRINEDKVQGATSEELNQRLDQALQGFNKGFNEAKSIIEQLGIMNDKLAGEIQDTYDRVTNGIDELRASVSEPVQPSRSLVQVGRSEQLSSQQSFSFEVITQDGDRVEINASRSFSTSESTLYQQQNDSEQLVNTRSVSRSNQFQLNVVGDLDEDETKAINDLLSDIDSLASDFYSGNLDEALQAASSLSFDGEELAQFELNLSRSIEYRAVNAYQQINDYPFDEQALNEQPIDNARSQNDLPTSALNNIIENASAMNQRIADMVESATAFSEPLQLLDDLLSRVFGAYAEQREGQKANAETNPSASFTAMASRLLDRIEQ